jgi:hypothetical protein
LYLLDMLLKKGRPEYLPLLAGVVQEVRAWLRPAFRSMQRPFAAFIC